jgi:hypothetical protein
MTTITAGAAGLPAGGDRLSAGEALRFATEAEQGDDSAAGGRWVDAVRATPPVPADLSAAADGWQAGFAAFNVEAVRRQFDAGGP